MHKEQANEDKKQDLDPLAVDLEPKHIKWEKLLSKGYTISEKVN